MKKVLLAVSLFLAASSAWATDIYVLLGERSAYNLYVSGGLSAKLNGSVINCTSATAKIWQFTPNYSSASLYGGCIQKVAGRVVKGVILMAGDNDTATEADVKAYAGTASNIIRSFRSDLGQPNVKLVMTTLNYIQPGQWIVTTNWNNLRTWQISMSAPNMTKIALDGYFMLDTEKLLTPLGYQNLATAIASKF